MTKTDNQKSNIKLCECGCGQPTRFYRGRYNRYILRHSNRGMKMKWNRKGENNPNYNGGTFIKNNYLCVKKPNHPFCDTQGYVKQHRLIYEHYLYILTDEEIFIPKTYDVHHIIPVKQGGINALINLELLTHSEHFRLH